MRKHQVIGLLVTITSTAGKMSSRMMRVPCPRDSLFLLMIVSSQLPKANRPFNLLVFRFALVLPGPNWASESWLAPWLSMLGRQDSPAISTCDLRPAFSHVENAECLGAVPPVPSWWLPLKWSTTRFQFVFQACCSCEWGLQAIEREIEGAIVSVLVLDLFRSWLFSRFGPSFQNRPQIVSVLGCVSFRSWFIGPFHTPRNF